MKWNLDYKDLSNVLDLLKKSIFFSVFCVALAFIFISIGAIEVRAQGSCTTDADCVAPAVCVNDFCGVSADPNVPGDDGPIDTGGGSLPPGDGGVPLPPIDPDGGPVQGGTDCMTNSDCDDNNLCTDDSCDSATGCVNTAASDETACGDGDLCNGNETCQSGTCTAGTALVCLDVDFCTTGSCDAVNGCVNTPAANGTACADGDQCNGDETCQSGTCTAGTALDCDDSLFCNGTETCDAATGCLTGTAPEDGAVCSEDPEGICIDLGCVFDGMITIVKMADPNDGTDFLFGCTDSSGGACIGIGDISGMFTLNDESEDTDGVPDTETFTAVLAGVYSIQEVLLPGWEATNIICENDTDDGTVVDLVMAEALIDLDPGEDITCTFWNELSPFCGDGVLDQEEGCDDGNNDDGDGCSANCELESTCNCEDPNAIIATRLFTFGTNGDDIICGRDRRDIIFAGGGNDCIDGRGGNDRIFLGRGDDIADGGDGRDVIVGGRGFDECINGEIQFGCEN